jgi:ankyrin repeat protein
MIDDHRSTPLHIACWGNPPVEVVRALLRACPHAATDKDILGNTPLHVATGHPNTDPAVVREILSVCPTAASITNKEGLMPLHMACRHAPSNEAVILALIHAYPYALKTRTKVSGSTVKKYKCVRSMVPPSAQLLEISLNKVVFC